MPEVQRSCLRLEELGARSLKQGHLGYYFKADSETIYRLVYMTRVSTRILAPLIHFNCHSANYLYKSAQQINWTDFLTLTKTFAITANTADSQLRNSNYAAQVLKDAIVDQFRDALENDRISIHVSRSTTKSLVHKNRARISVDLGGGSLHKRGYRTERVVAPMQENVAATILRLSEWDANQPLFDPFCGSGTILIEAAMKLTNFPAARFRSKFGFLRLPDFDPTLWNQIKTEANRAVTALPEYQIRGSDIDALQFARPSKCHVTRRKNIHSNQDFRSINH